MQQQQHHGLEEYDEKMNQMRIVEEEKGRGTNEDVLVTKRNINISKPYSRDQMMMVDNNLNNNESLKQHDTKKGLELQLFEKDVLLNNLKKEVENLKSYEANAMAMFSEYRRKLQELEFELDKRKESEANLFDTLVMQTKQLEQSKISLEESKFEISNLEEKLKALQNSKTRGESKDGIVNDISIMEIEKGVKNEAEMRQMELNNEAQKGKDLTIGVKALLEELNMLKNELKSATLAEENSKNAMDDLVFALKEVAIESNEAKAKLTLSQVELEHTKGNAERWRAMLASTKVNYKEVLDATRKEAERFKNTAERLRLEAEESLSAWSGKETEFVNCIRRVEEERVNTQKETARVFEMLSEAENKVKVSKDENQKLRDILKQALNEANVAKGAAEIAKAENAKLHDSLALLVQENEMLKIHEAASFENIKELKRLLSESSKKESKHEDNEDKELVKKAKTHHNKENHNHKQQQQQHKMVNEEAIGKNKEIEDDISDLESQHDVHIGIHSDDFDHLDESHFDDSDGERNSRKKGALLRKFGDLIRRGNLYHNRKDSSNEEHLHQVTNITQVAK
ncbi:unnamed protein product [Lupinus luteus]|uniref:WEB family protein n=1 Tax=Lupinus luteus TaxID=3873 RepID=A0AAV1Y2X5_LUPLU